MTDDTLERLAREAGFDGPGANMLYTVRGNHAQLARFAALVRADALEQAAKVADNTHPHEFAFIGSAIRALKDAP